MFSLLSSDGRRFATFYDRGRFCVWDDAPREAARHVSARGKADGRRRLQPRRPACPPGRVERRRRGVGRELAGTKDPIARLRSRHEADLGAVRSHAARTSWRAATNGVAQVWQVKPQATARGLCAGTRTASSERRFSPNGALVATVSDDGSARLWPSRPRSRTTPAGGAPTARRSARARATCSSSAAGGARSGTQTRERRSSSHEGGVAMPNHLVWPCGRAAGCSPWSRNGTLRRRREPARAAP